MHQRLRRRRCSNGCPAPSEWELLLRATRAGAGLEPLRQADLPGVRLKDPPGLQPAATPSPSHPRPGGPELRRGPDDVRVRVHPWTSSKTRFRQPMSWSTAVARVAHLDDRRSGRASRRAPSDRILRSRIDRNCTPMRRACADVVGLRRRAPDRLAAAAAVVLQPHLPRRAGRARRRTARSVASRTVDGPADLRVQPRQRWSKLNEPTKIRLRSVAQFACRPAERAAHVPVLRDLGAGRLELEEPHARAQVAALRVARVHRSHVLSTRASRRCAPRRCFGQVPPQRLRALCWYEERRDQVERVAGRPIAHQLVERTRRCAGCVSVWRDRRGILRRSSTRRPSRRTITADERRAAYGLDVDRPTPGRARRRTSPSARCRRRRRRSVPPGRPYGPLRGVELLSGLAYDVPTAIHVDAEDDAVAHAEDLSPTLRLRTTATAAAGHWAVHAPSLRARSR